MILLQVTRFPARSYCNLGYFAGLFLSFRKTMHAQVGSINRGKVERLGEEGLVVNLEAVKEPGVVGTDYSVFCVAAFSAPCGVFSLPCVVPLGSFNYFIMVVVTTASSFFLATASSSAASAKASLLYHGGNSKIAFSSGGVQIKANVRVAPHIKGAKISIKTELQKTEDEVISSAPQTIYDQLHDWSMLLAAILTWEPMHPDMLADAFGLGKLVQHGLVFRQNFFIRSYEIGSDRTGSIETLMNYLQETSLNHAKCLGIMGEGFGATWEMNKCNLIWVVTKMQVLVEHYPSWGDAVEIDTWISASGKNGMRRDWHVRDCQTGQTITCATSIWVMMNKDSRRLSKIPEKVRQELEPHFLERVNIVDKDTQKISKLDENTADYICKGLAPRRSDFDVNQHVNNVKYISWILESAPDSILESHELASITVEYRKECGRDSVLQSLTSVSGNCTGEGSSSSGRTGIVECEHQLRLVNGAEVVRGRTAWRPK